MFNASNARVATGAYQGACGLSVGKIARGGRVQPVGKHGTGARRLRNSQARATKQTNASGKVPANAQSPDSDFRLEDMSMLWAMPGMAE